LVTALLFWAWPGAELATQFATAVNPKNTIAPIKAMPTYRPAKKYTKPIGLTAASAPYFPLLHKKRRIKTSPPKKPKTIPRKSTPQNSIAQWK
jgi:hypothetical protein